MGIPLRTTLTDADWDKTIGGWKCDALLIPGAKLSALYFDGHDATQRQFRAVENAILWSQGSRPKSVVATIILEQDFAEAERRRVDLETAKDNLEHEKLQLEKDKFRSERRWKIYSAIGAVFSAVIGGIGTSHLLPAAFITTKSTDPSADSKGVLTHYGAV